MIGLGYPNLADTATTSGGSWQAGLPVANVQTRSFAKVARSTDATTGSTQFRLDHGSAKSARALCLAGHNLTAAATITWSRGTSSGGAEVYAGAAVNAWQITPYTVSGRDYAVVIVLPQAYSARHDLIEIADAANPAGYVEIARAWVSSVWVPTYNAAYGLRDGIEDLSSVDRSDGGALWVTQRRKLRTVELVLEGLTPEEADALHNVQMAAGTTDEVLYLPDLTSPAAQQRYGYISTLHEISAIEYPFHRMRTLPLRLREVA
jgi:hypothetical protein